MSEEQSKVEAKRSGSMMEPDGDRGYGEGASARPVETPVQKPKRKRGATGDEGEGKRRRKPKATMEVESTYTELKRLLQEMRPYTLQVLRTPYYRNCKAARNMRKAVRQIRDFCKQVRLETVLLAKKKQGDEVTKRRRKKPEASPAGEEVPARNLDLEGPSPSHSPEHHSNEEKADCLIPREPLEPSESSEVPKPRIPVSKSENSPAQRDWDLEIAPPKKEKSPRREREREFLREREKSPRREKSPKSFQKRPLIEDEELMKEEDYDESE
ncbi:hypothetical protein R1sor_002842 [Riccia sorocarpa]|uniref:Uncharacterized protein n=1 Tax=Riccia sorocarpa TaxID=122646 RepID=A0ABD3H3B6_9MARC